MIVTLRALDGKAKQSGRSVLHHRLEGVITVRSHLVWIAIAFPRTILPIAKEMRRLQEFDRFRGNGLTGYEPSYFVTRNLFDDKAIEWFLKAAETGDTDAQLIVARAYLDGKGHRPDEAKAKYWFEKCVFCANQSFQKKSNR